ncbi:MAG: membrane protein [Silanimonas sp.]|nr:MAG: membrane protein [Silanimonas sp.]
MRRLHALLESYSADHVNATNQAIHLVCVPAIVWSVIAALWTVPVPGSLLQPGAFAGLVMAAAAAWYFRQSRPLGLGITLAFVLAGASCWWLAGQVGMRGLLFIAIAVFVLAWIGQFIGHRIEGKRPSFFTDLVYLLVGPAWTLSKLYRRLGIAY